MKSSDCKQGPEARPQTWCTLALLALTALVRILVAHHALGTFGSGWFFLRGTEMGYLAQSILAGKGFSSPFGTPTGPTAMICPGYPLIVAGVFWIFGSYSVASATVLLAFNIVLNVLCTWWILVLGRRLASPRSAVWVAAFWALSPPLLWMPTIFWDTSLSAAGLLGAVVLATRTATPLRLSHWFLFGALAGLLGLVNPALMPCLVVIAVLTALRGAGIAQRMLLFLGGAVLLFASWPLRNAEVFHTWIPTRTTMGFELWMGNREGAEGFLDRASFPTYNPGELKSYKAEGEVSYMQRKQRLALGHIRQYPAKFLLLTAKRIARYWTGTGTRPEVFAYTLHACVTTVLGIGGVLKLLRRRSHLALLFGSVFLLLPLPYYVTHAEFRYRLVIDPLLLALAALPIESVLFARADRSQQSVTAPQAMG